jgi:dTMP kinase
MTPAPPGRGRFVVIEGPEGAGKSTQLARLQARLAAVGRAPLLTREPGGTKAGEAMRHVLLDPQLHIEPLAEFLLYSAARAQHVQEVIAPALAQGRDVISDRYTGASVAYQGHGRGLDLQLVSQLNEVATGGLKPERTVLLDLAPAAGLARAAARASYDRLEAAGLSFHERARQGYLQQAAADPTWVLIDASEDEEQVANALWRAVHDLLAPPSGAAP